MAAFVHSLAAVFVGAVGLSLAGSRRLARAYINNRLKAGNDPKQSCRDDA